MPQYILTLLFIMGIAVGTANADSAVEQALLQKTSYTITGSFSPYDFAPKGDNNPFDWAYATRTSGRIYQLHGVAPTSKSVFGWKEVTNEFAASRPSTPMWYMFRLDGDIDGDGSLKFDWVLVLATGNKAAYKLVGIRENGTFKYSDKLDIDYKIVGNTVITAAAGTFGNTNVPDNNDSVIENNNTGNTTCIPLPQEPVGQQSVLRVTKYYTNNSRYTDVTHTVVSNSPTSMTITEGHRSSNNNDKIETLTTIFTINGNYKDIGKRVSERTGLSPRTTLYAPYWREPFREVCDQQTWNFNVTVTESSETTSQAVTYNIVALHESKTVAGGTFNTIHIQSTTNSATTNQWIDTTTGALVAEEIRNPDNSLQKSTELLSLQ